MATRTKHKGANAPAGRKAAPAKKQTAKVKAPVKDALKLVKVRNSKVHGRGVFALKRIPKGTRIWEYVGERMSHKRVNERYEGADERDNHTFLFAVDRNVVIDATRDGNDSRFINHGCDPNCESTIEDRRVFIDVIRTIKPGEELNYDYQIGRDRNDPPDVDVIYACRCGSPECRGTMLWPAKRPEPRQRRAKTAARKGAGSGKRKRA
jgi:SET domain-containing protein